MSARELLSSARRLARPLVALALGLVVLTGAGCGHGGHGHHDDGGTLNLVNHSLSTFIIDEIDIAQPFGPIETFIVDLFPGEEVFIDLIEGPYDGIAFWSDGLEEPFFFDIFEDNTTQVVLFN